MKKRIISLVLVVAMLLCVLPAASATGTETAKPDIAKYSLVLNKSISINFKVTGLNADNIDDYTVTFKEDGVDVETSITPYAEGDMYVFTYDLTPRKLGTKVKMTIEDANGLVDETERSVQDYCRAVLDGEYSGNLKTLVVDLLNYGAAAQAHFDKDIEYVPANSILSDAEKLLASQADPDLTSDKENNTEGYITHAGLTLDHSVKVYFLAAEGVEKLNVKVGDYIDEDITASENGYFYFDKLNADQMRELITVQAYDANGAAGGTLTYSIVSYAVDAPVSNTMDALMEAMMKYGDTASGYRKAPSSDTINALFYDDFSTMENWGIAADDTKAAITDEGLAVTLTPGTGAYYTLKNVSMPTDQKYAIEYRMKIVGDTAGYKFQGGILGKATTDNKTVINVGKYQSIVNTHNGSKTVGYDNDFHTYRIEVDPILSKVSVSYDDTAVVTNVNYNAAGYECNYLLLMIKDNVKSDGTTSDKNFTAVYDYFKVEVIPEVQSDELLTAESVDDNETKIFNATSGRISFEWDYTLNPGESTAADAKLLLVGDSTALNISAKYRDDVETPGYYFCTYDKGAEDTNHNAEGTHLTLTECKPGETYHVKVVVDLDYKRYDLYVDDMDTPIIDFCTLRSNFTTDTINSIVTQNTTEGVTATFTNVTVKKTDERVGVLYSNDFSDKDGGVAYKGVTASFDKQYCSIVVECRIRHYAGIDTKLLIRGSATIANFSLQDNYCKNNGTKLAASVGKVNVGQWNDVRIELTYKGEGVKGTYTAYVNGEAVATNVATGNVIPYINHVSFTTNVAGDYYVDDLIVYKAG